ncbi:MAG: hypothetical protein ACLR17_20425 [Enterobacteriaceae bacterium]
MAITCFCGVDCGNIVLNFTAEKFKPEQLLYFSLSPIFIGIMLALVMTLIWQNIIALIIGMAIYAFGLGICNATLYRLTLFSSEHGKGSVSAMIGMISVAIFSLGGINGRIGHRRQPQRIYYRGHYSDAGSIIHYR